MRFDSNNTVPISIGPDTPSYRFCNQDFLRFAERYFPFIPSNQPEGDEWMTEEQEQVTLIYGWASVGALCFVAVTFIQGWVEKLIKWLYGESISVVEDQRINFSDVTNISAYIPHVASDVFSYPLFVCNMDEIGEEVIDWRDPLRPHAFYDLTKDADKILEGINIENKCIFSQVSFKSALLLWLLFLLSHRSFTFVLPADEALATRFSLCTYVGKIRACGDLPGGRPIIV